MASQTLSASQSLATLLEAKLREYEGIELNDPSNKPVPHYAQQKKPPAYPKQRPMSPRDPSSGPAVVWDHNEDTELSPSPRSEATLTQLCAHACARARGSEHLVPSSTYMFSEITHFRELGVSARRP